MSRKSALAVVLSCEFVSHALAQRCHLVLDLAVELHVLRRARLFHFELPLCDFRLSLSQVVLSVTRWPAFRLAFQVPHECPHQLNQSRLTYPSLLLKASFSQPDIDLVQELPSAVLTNVLGEDGLCNEFEQDYGPCLACFDDVASCATVEPFQHPCPHLNHDVLQPEPFAAVLVLDINLRLHRLDLSPRPDLLSICSGQLLVDFSPGFLIFFGLPLLLNGVRGDVVKHDQIWLIFLFGESKF